MKHTLFLILISTILFSCSNEKQVNLKIIETTDIHGSFFPDNLLTGKTKTSLANVSTYVKKQRENVGQSVILLDNGDILQGEPSAYYFNFEHTTSTHICSDILNYMKYDAATIGNHDIETGHKVYDKIVEEFKFPWLAANITNTKTNKPYFKPYTILKKDNLKIAVLGLITPGIPSWLPPKIWEDMQFDDMVETAQEYIPILKNKEKADIIIGLFHAGSDYTYNNQDSTTYKNYNASLLVAQKVDGFDLVFTGHDHKEINRIIKNNFGNEVLVLGAKNSAKSIACANIKITLSDNEIKSIKRSGEIVSMKNYKPDNDYLIRFKKQSDLIKNYVNKPIGKITKTIDSKESLFKSNAFTDLIHNIQLDLTNADVSFTAPLSLNSKIKKGKIYVKDMFKLYRYENLLYTMRLSGRKIKDYLEFSYSMWFGDGKDHLLLLNKNKLKNPYFNFDSAAGIDYIYDVTKPKGERIKIISFSNGKKFDFEKTYKVAINSYRGNGGGNHLIIGSGIKKADLQDRIINSTEKDLRYYLMKWIEKEKTINPKANNNWKVVPENLYNKLRDKDYDILF